MRRTDQFWYGQMIDHDPASKELNFTQKSSIIENSMLEAERQKMCIERQLKAWPPREILERLGFQVTEESSQLMPGFLYFGLLIPDEKKIEMNETVIQLTQQWLRRHFDGDHPVLTRFRDIILYHELYHAVEERTPEIYTRNVKVSRRILGRFSRTIRLEAASEVGAVHFSKLAAGVDFCPYLYTQYLIHAARLYGVFGGCI